MKSYSKRYIQVPIFCLIAIASGDKHFLKFFDKIEKSSIDIDLWSFRFMVILTQKM